MAQFLKKGSLGRLVPADGGESDPDLYEVRLTAEEYEDLCSRIDIAESKRRQTKKQMEEIAEQARRKNERVIASANRQLEEYKTKIDQEAEQRIAAAVAVAQEVTLRAEQAEQALVKQINLNHNLKRIARERANSDRGITPKKDHDGYLVLSSRQWKEKYMYDLTEEEYKKMPDEFKRKHSYPCSEQRTADVWKSVIQTPYDASIPIGQIGPIIEMDDLWVGGILADLGCVKMLESEYNGIYDDFGINEDGYGINGLYKWVYVANYKSGLWEMEIFTTKSLRVPPYRRPEVLDRKKHKKPKKKEKQEISEVVYEVDDEKYF